LGRKPRKYPYLGHLGKSFFYSKLTSQTLELVKDIPNAHRKKINAFLLVGDHVWSGSDDGVVLVWKKDTFEVSTH
jgi:hypothetical protein